MTPTQVDIGRNQHGNGRPAWLAHAPAASLRRVDHHRGKTTPVNWAGRSEAEQFTLVKKYYVRANFTGEFFYDGSWWRKKSGSRVIVAKPTTSPHEPGNAVDTDEWTVPGFVALMAEHGWIRTLKSEPWHFVYFAHLDQHRNDPAPSGGASTTEDDMFEDADRALLRETLTQVRNVHKGVWTGGSINGKTFNYGVLPIVAHNQALIGQMTVQINALSAAVTALATAQGADPDAILKVVEAGVKDAMRDVSFSVDIDG